ncbi:MAG: glycosyltransferase, partial [Campylobacterales bacterium]|nr:glycosyltransferase [Campylobacterales bacterium]
MNPLVSIIIPIYNVENYLNTCIESVIKQTNQDFELILINDGSTDKSGEICEEYHSKLEKVKIIHLKNSGVSSARNTGIASANGKWILFLDGDDTLNTETVNIIERINGSEPNVNMILGSFYYRRESGITSADNIDLVISGVKACLEYGLWRTKICMGSFAVKSEIIRKNNLSFNTGTRYGEDVEFINYCLLNSNQIKKSSYHFFYYNINNTSAITKISFDRYHCYEARLRTLQYIEKKFPDNKELQDIYINHLLPEAI